MSKSRSDFQTFLLCDFQIFSALSLDKSLCLAYNSVIKAANKRTSIRANSIHRCDEKLPASMITVPQIG